jgi:hypothetical protein
VASVASALMQQDSSLNGSITTTGRLGLSSLPLTKKPCTSELIQVGGQLPSQFVDPSALSALKVPLALPVLMALKVPKVQLVLMVHKVLQVLLALLAPPVKPAPKALLAPKGLLVLPVAMVQTVPMALMAPMVLLPLSP